MNFGITLKLGIGDILLYWAAFEKIKHKYESIYIDANFGIIDHFCGGSENYRIFVIDLIKMLFNDPKYKLFTGAGYPGYEFSDLANHGIYPVLPNIRKFLGNSVINGEYIVITTKARQLYREKFNNVKDKLIENLKRLSERYKIIIMGERVVPDTPEYLAVGGQQWNYSIYDQLVGLDNVVDLTEAQISFNEISLDKMLKDASIMAGATGLISFGCGGNLIIGTAVNNNVICYRVDEYTFVDNIFKPLKITKDGRQFVRYLEGL